VTKSSVHGITAANVGSLTRRQLHLDGTVDSSPIYGNGTFYHDDVRPPGDRRAHRSGMAVRPPAYSRSRVAADPNVAGGRPSGEYIYAAASDGRVRKLRASNGRVVWTVAVTRDPTREKLTSSLNFARGMVIATTGGYIGDAPPYQGHVVTIGAASGRIVHVWNSLCADRQAIIVPRSWPSSDSAIWSRNGAAVDPGNGNLVVATGNGPYNGSTDFGDSVIVLTPTASGMVGHWTPDNQAQLNSSDQDLGSTSPGLLPNGYAVQGGKDGVLRLLQLHGRPRLPAVAAGRCRPRRMFSVPDGRPPGPLSVRLVATGAASTRRVSLLRAAPLHPAWSNSAHA
jgi:hypothetical protein